MDNSVNEAEKALLGGSIANDKVYFKVSGALTADDFESDAHRTIFKDLSELRTKGAYTTATSLIEYMKDKKTLNLVGGKDYITALCTLQPLEDEVLYYINIVKDHSLVRTFFKTIDDIKTEYNTKSVEDISEFIGVSEKKILDVTEKRRVSDFRGPQEIIPSLINEINATKLRRQQLNLNAPYLTGYPSGYPALDKITGGFQPGDLIILAARPSVGKTALALNFAQRVAKQGRTVGVFSLEMTAEQILLRLLSSESQLPSNKIKSMDFDSIHEQYGENKSDAYSLNCAIDTMKNERLFIDDSSDLKLIDIQSKARKLKAKYPDLSLIVIDYIGLITSPSKANAGNRQQEVAEISRGLKFLAKDLQVPVIALSQLSRGVEARKDHKPGLSDLRESGAIEQDADQVMFIYRKDYYRNEEDGNDKNGIPMDPPLESETQSSNDGDNNNVSNVELIIAKNRNGRVDDVRFVFFKDVCRFEVAADGDEGGQY